MSIEIVNQLASQMHCEPRALLAVIQAESAGLGHGIVDCRPLIRLEVHHLWAMVPTSKRDQVDAWFNVAGRPVPLNSPDRIQPITGALPWLGHQFLENGSWKALHQINGQGLEWRALDFARKIDSSAAIQSTSWGLGQILGEYWDEMHFTSPEDFALWQMTEDHQLDTMARYISLSPSMLRALQSKDWTTFARMYNGPSNVAHYSERLAEEYKRLT